MPRDSDFLYSIRGLLGQLDGDVSLGSLAARRGGSSFHFHRTFRRIIGETPKQYTLRLRLERAGARLAASDESVLEIALASGFASHEVFTRAFRRHFGCTPVRYRAVALKNASASERARHLALTHRIGPCIRLFRFSQSPSKGSTMPVLSIARREIAPQPVLFIRRRIAANEVQATLAECFGKLYGHAQSKGLPIAGFPIARYISTGPGLWTIEPSIPLAAPAAGEGEMEAGFLPGGPVAFAVHAGPYEQLPQTNAAVQRWIEDNGFRTEGAPWEWYVTDPGEHPDPADWKTEVYWPLVE
jgi:AraC family transcriptional regulator